MIEQIRVLIVDDHAVVRQGLRTFLESEVGIQVVGEAVNGDEAVTKARELLPQVILMDLVMPGTDGIKATRELSGVAPTARVLVLTSFGEDDRVLAAIKAGATGYLLKDVPAEELGFAIRSIARGDFLLQSDIAIKVLDELFSRTRSQSLPSADLTPREIAVLSLIARGRSNKDIAQDLCISVKTVKTHVGNILGKLQMADRTQAALYAVRQGLIPETDSESDRR